MSDVSTMTTSTSSQDFFQTFHRPQQLLSNNASTIPSSSTGSSSLAAATQPTVNISMPPVPLQLQNMTQSQQVFSIATGIDAHSFTISSKPVFFLFMDMWAERQWASFWMTPNKLVAEVNEYNQRLDVVNQEANLVPVNKHPRALHEMLGKIEQKVIEWITNNNYKCEPILHLTNTPLTSTALFSPN